MPREHVIEIDASKPLAEDPQTGHNRWHEAIEPVVEVDPGDTVIYETRDAVDGQLNPHSTVTDVGNLDLNPIHPLTGPVFVKGAEPGDLLEASSSPSKQIHGISGVHGRDPRFRLPAGRLPRPEHRSLAAAGQPICRVRATARGADPL
jgi:hypothetical protein